MYRFLAAVVIQHNNIFLNRFFSLFGFFVNQSAQTNEMLWTQECLHCRAVVYMFIGELCKSFIDLIYVCDSFALLMFARFCFGIGSDTHRMCQCVCECLCVYLILYSIRCAYFSKYVHFNMNLFCQLKNEYICFTDTQHNTQAFTSANLCKGVLSFNMIWNNFLARCCFFFSSSRFDEFI